jgi:hypothetical protein
MKAVAAGVVGLGAALRYAAHHAPQSGARGFAPVGP